MCGCFLVSTRVELWWKKNRRKFVPKWNIPSLSSLFLGGGGGITSWPNPIFLAPMTSHFEQGKLYKGKEKVRSQRWQSMLIGHMLRAARKGGASRSGASPFPFLSTTNFPAKFHALDTRGDGEWKRTHAHNKSHVLLLNWSFSPTYTSPNTPFSFKYLYVGLVFGPFTSPLVNKFAPCTPLIAQKFATSASEPGSFGTSEDF